MTLRATIRIVPDSRRQGGARAEGAVLTSSLVDVVFQGFALGDATAYAALTDAEGVTIAPAATLAVSGGGATGKGTLDCNDELLRDWAEGEGHDTARLALFTNTVGWLASADVAVARMPELPSIPSP